MSSTPSVAHQSISLHLTGILYQFFQYKDCRFFVAPFDVRLYDKNQSELANHDCMAAGGRAMSGAVAEDIYSVVQPDLCVISDSNKLDPQGCLGAPDWIIEILSEGSSKKEMQIKYELYQENGVLEYWLVYPFEQAVYQFILDATTQKYRLFKMYSGVDKANSYLFPDLEIDLQEVFGE